MLKPQTTELKPQTKGGCFGSAHSDSTAGQLACS